MMDEAGARCRDAEPKLASRRTTVCDTGPTFTQHCLIVVCVVWKDLTDKHETLNQCCFNAGPPSSVDSTSSARRSLHVDLTTSYWLPGQPNFTGYGRDTTGAICEVFQLWTGQNVGADLLWCRIDLRRLPSVRLGNVLSKPIEVLLCRSYQVFKRLSHL